MIDSALAHKGVITGNLNRTDIVPGYYMINGLDTVSNAPSGTEYTTFIQFIFGYNAQLVITPNGVKARRYVGSPQNWPAWA